MYRVASNIIKVSQFYFMYVSQFNWHFLFLLNNMYVLICKSFDPFTVEHLGERNCLYTMMMFFLNPFYVNISKMWRQIYLIVYLIYQFQRKNMQKC